MRFTLSNGVQVEQIQRDGFMELVCAGNPDRVLTSGEWNEAADLIVNENRKRFQTQKEEGHKRSVESFRLRTIGHRFPIGTTYKTGGKHSRVCTVVDLLTVTNAAGLVVKRYYKSSHEFMGQTVYDHDVCETTIARNLL